MAKEQNIIMLVDDDNTSLTMGSKILEKQYTLYPIPSGHKLFEIMKKIRPDLILLDIEMPNMDGYEIIKHLKGNSDTVDIPIIFLTAHNDPGSELQGLSLGAIDYVSKPFSAPILTKRIENHLLLAAQKRELKRYNHSLQEMVSEQTLGIKNLQSAILNIVSEIVEFRDELSGGHIERIIAHLTTMIDAMAEKGIYRDEIENWDKGVFMAAAQMHDVGKIFISEAILNKPKRLSPKEFLEIKKHPAYGLIIIDKIRQMVGEHLFLSYAGVITETHHERWDGNGYPAGLAGLNIPLMGRLMAVADIYDALVSLRPYKQPMSTSEATEEIIKLSGTALDPALVEVFKTRAEDFARISERHDILI